MERKSEKRRTSKETYSMKQMSRTAKAVVVYSTRRLGNGRPKIRSTQRHHDVTAVQHRHGEQVDDREVDVEQDQEAQRQPLIRVHVGGQHGQDARRAAQILHARRPSASSEPGR